MAGIEICGVSKTYRDGTRAVAALDLTVRDGELLVLVGPSGSGKSTTLRLIAGLEDPSGGTLRIGGREMVYVPPQRRNIAMVFQGLGLLGHLTARDNLRFGLRLREAGRRGWFSPWKGERAEEEATVAWAAKLLGIEHLLGKRPAELSGGEQQRVAIGRALVRRPAVFLLDEPLANLDPPTRLVLRRENGRLQRELGVTMVYVTHDQAEALALGDRIAAMHGGRLQQVGTPAEVYRRPRNRFVASLFGSHGMNFLEGSIHRGDGEPWVSVGQWRLPLGAAARRLGARLEAAENGSRRVLIGIRPEDARVTTEPLPGACPAHVEQVEYQGNTTYAQVRIAADQGEPRLTAHCGSATPLLGAKVYISLSEDNLCWFDAVTGENWNCRDEPRSEAGLS
jgi:multiple sugar transport system ATP-binding protein